MKEVLKKRSLIQAGATLLTNWHLPNFLTGQIYSGAGKAVCVPGLNCYSCPAATGACPIGAFQAVVGGAKHTMSYYIFGLLIFFGTLFGRLICGFFCPFGFFQDLIYKIKTPKIKVKRAIDLPLRKIKYFILAVFVILLPMFLTNNFGIGAPYFCKFICPVGTLEGGIPLLIKHESLRNAVGVLFSWKVFLLILTIFAAIFIYRSFCKYICPLGAFYSLFNRFSFYGMKVDKHKCNGCKTCENQCKMNVEITENINSLECIRCGECVSACENGAISSGFKSFAKENISEDRTY